MIMRLSEQVKSVTFLKRNTGEIMNKLAENRQPLIITQNGEATAVLLDVHEYDKKMETIALLKRLVIASKEREEGHHRPYKDAVKDIRKKFSEHNRDGDDQKV